MKSNIFDIQHFSTGDGPGIRTTVFFQGCPMNCPWCHNPEGIARRRQLMYFAERCVGCRQCVEVCRFGAQTWAGGVHTFTRENCTSCGECEKVCLGALKLAGTAVENDIIVDEIMKDLPYYRRSGGGVTLSGGEPLLQSASVEDIAKKLSELGVSVILDTSFSVCARNLAGILKYTDTVLADVKCADAEKFSAVCGGNLGGVLAEIERARGLGANLILRQPYVPGFHDGRQTELLADLFAKLQLPVTVLPFHRMGGGKYRALGLNYAYADVTPPSDGEVNVIEELYRRGGVTVIPRGEF